MQWTGTRPALTVFYSDGHFSDVHFTAVMGTSQQVDLAGGDPEVSTR